MKKLSILFGSLAILTLLATGTILFNVNILPQTDKWFLSLFFTSLAFTSLTIWFHEKSQEIYTTEGYRIKKRSLRDMIIAFVASITLLVMTIFGLP